ncbi:MAG: hypothetical protein ACK4PI_11035 [Tepidisphaerales bacterium]
MSEQPLTAQRVRLLAARRLATMRTRTYVWVGLGGAAAVVMLSAARAWDAVAAGRWADLRLYLFLLFAVAGSWAVVRLWRRQRELTQALRQRPAEPLPEPDFTPLSDGSAVWKNLERVADDRDPDDHGPDNLAAGP